MLIIESNIKGHLVFGDYVCIQYHNLLSNPKSQYFELDESKKITWVAHGRIISGDDDEDIKITFPENTILPETPLSDKIMLFRSNTTTNNLQVIDKYAFTSIVYLVIHAGELD